MGLFLQKVNITRDYLVSCLGVQDRGRISAACETSTWRAGAV